MLLVVGAFRGELVHFEPQQASLVSLAAFLYLIVFGSLVAFSAYTWLIRTAEPTLVSTHTYVNPVVAIILGWWIAHEPVGTKTLVASALILGSVVLMTFPRKAQQVGVRGASQSPV
jgi:drug/metabolite transporter (DMT)-like permease